MSRISQLPLFDAPVGGGQEVRLVHYLGSKLRLLGPIREAIARVAPEGTKVCDLFAGSGSVAHALSYGWQVTSVDIQEYSRVLCSALLRPPSREELKKRDLAAAAEASSLRETLRASLAPLMEHETDCLGHAERGEPEDLCDLLQHGSLQAMHLGGSVSSTTLQHGMRLAWRELAERGFDTGNASVITRHFGGVYFSWEQAIDLDALLARAHQLPSPVRDTFLAAVLATASEVVNTVGKQFAQPIRPRDGKGEPKRHLVKQTLRDRSMNVLDTFRTWVRRLEGLPRQNREHRPLRADFRTLLADDSIQLDAVYADPPYTRDHYSRYYHVLETMALHDDPQVSTTMIRTDGSPRPSRGLYRVDRHQSHFCIKSKVPAAFDELFAGVARRGVPLVLSYSPYEADSRNRPRLLMVEELETIARRHFSRVECQGLGGMAHNKFNLMERNVAVNHHAEVLFLCEV